MNVNFFVKFQGKVLVETVTDVSPIFELINDETERSET